MELAQEEGADLVGVLAQGGGFRVGRRAVREPPVREDRWGWPRRSARTWSGSLRRAAVSGLEDGRFANRPYERGQMGLAQEECADLVGVLEEVGGLTQGIFNGPN